MTTKTYLRQAIRNLTNRIGWLEERVRFAEEEARRLDHVFLWRRVEELKVRLEEKKGKGGSFEGIARSVITADKRLKIALQHAKDGVFCK